MVLVAIKSALKLAMASVALLILSGQLPNQFLLLGIIFLACGVILSTIKTIEARPDNSAPPPGMSFPNYPGMPDGKIPPEETPEGYQENISEQQRLVEQFINDVMNFCAEQGENCTLMSQQDGLWVVRVNEENGSVDKIINLSIPDEKDVTKENIVSIRQKTFDEIMVKLKQFKD